MGAALELRDLPAGLLTRLDKRASEEGLDLQSFVVRLLEREVSRSETNTFDSILKPLRRAVDESGMSEEEIEALAQSEVDANRRDRRDRSSRA